MEEFQRALRNVSLTRTYECLPEATIRSKRGGCGSEHINDKDVFVWEMEESQAQFWEVKEGFPVEVTSKLSF